MVQPGSSRMGEGWRAFWPGVARRNTQDSKPADSLITDVSLIVPYLDDIDYLFFEP